MSINTNPDLYDYLAPGTGCPTCFDVNETPEKMIVSITGMLIGDDWLVTDPPPPNGLVVIESAGGCSWTLNDGIWIYTWAPTAPADNFIITLIGDDIAFLEVWAGSCAYDYTNFYASGANRKYYGGLVHILPTLEGGPDSLPEVLALLSDDPIWATWANPKPISDTEVVHGFYNQTDKTNVKILYEVP